MAYDKTEVAVSKSHDEIRRLVIKRVGAQEIGKVAIGQGMKTLRRVALEKVGDGLSTLEQTLLLTSGEH